MQFIYLIIFSLSYVISIGEYEQIQKEKLRKDVKRMFYHAYNSYMNHAYPADELMPLSCKGRWRGLEPSRGDVDDILGNFSLTLIDTLDTLVILGDLVEFEKAVKLIIKDVIFDNDIVVSVFETNIRVLGGLLSAHVLSLFIQDIYNQMPWYKNELLSMAKDLGYRLLPAFNTTTGIPYSKVNLKYGITKNNIECLKETCTACAGTMILEFAVLSRLTNDSVFEEKAHKAMDSLWNLRHHISDLVGTILNVDSGDWIRRDSGVGAGIDSYYEYLLKAYVLLGDKKYLFRFNKHYSSVMKYVSQGPYLIDVHMHRPLVVARHYMDSLLAFWPGLQVLIGDLTPAIRTHEMLYQIHWGNHLLRPEFIESTYLLYRATGDSHYLKVGEEIVNNLQRYAKVHCGYAALKDIRTGIHEDRLDSFVLAETFKYLYLLFSEPDDLLIDMNDFLLSTEAHLFPLSLSHSSNFIIEENYNNRKLLNPTCPILYNSSYDSVHYADDIRKPIKSLFSNICPIKFAVKKWLKASEFKVDNADHVNQLQEMGISIVTMSEGAIQLFHTFSNAKSVEYAEAGFHFMQEIFRLSQKHYEQLNITNCFVTLILNATNVTLIGGPAQFGPNLAEHEVQGYPLIANPINACSEFLEPSKISGKIVIIQRGGCMFIEKVRLSQKAAAIAVIIIDNNHKSSFNSTNVFSMSGDGQEDIIIPSVFLFGKEASILMKYISEIENMKILLQAEKKKPKLEALFKKSRRRKFFYEINKSYVENQQCPV